MNRTRNLLIWSQTRYHCATDPFVVLNAAIIIIKWWLFVLIFNLYGKLLFICHMSHLKIIYFNFFSELGLFRFVLGVYSFSIIKFCTHFFVWHQFSILVFVLSSPNFFRTTPTDKKKKKQHNTSIFHPLQHTTHNPQIQTNFSKFSP